jgi:uncharacterized protein (TIGR00369 family)
LNHVHDQFSAEIDDCPLTAQTKRRVRRDFTQQNFQQIGSALDVADGINEEAARIVSQSSTDRHKVSLLNIKENKGVWLVPDVGFRKWLGLTYEEMTDEQATVSLDLDGDKVNVRGVGHGGVVASLVDVAMGTAAGGGNYDTRKRLVATQELKVNYLAAATGARMTATAKVIRAGNRSIVVSCDVLTDTGVHCATALGTFMTRRVSAGDPDRFQPKT